MGMLGRMAAQQDIMMGMAAMRARSGAAGGASVSENTGFDPDAGDEDDGDDGPVIRPFDLEKVFGALQQYKSEIAGMANEEERRKAAAKVALGLVYGLEGGKPDLPPSAFIVVGVNSTWEFLNYIGCPGVSVKRLLLSDSLDEDIVKNFGDYRQMANYSDLYEVEMVRHHNRLLDIKWEYAYRDYNVVIKSILEHVAPTLEALSWVQYNPKSLSNLGLDEYGLSAPYEALDPWIVEERSRLRLAYSPFFRTKFPLLTELTVRSPDGYHSAGRPAESVLSSGWALPSLTHLHLASCVPYDVLGRFVSWKIPSNITHIRLTGGRVLDESAPWTQVEKEVWDRYPALWEKIMRVFRGIPKLTIRVPELQPNITIIVQPDFPPTQDLDDHFQYSTEFWDSKERCYLPRYDRQLNKTLSHPRVHVKLPEKAALERYGPSSGVYSLAEAIEDFSSRSRGEDAGWLIPDKVTGEHSDERFWWWEDGKPPLKCPDGDGGYKLVD
ncbi:hypothetical protein NLJ89_g11342 [Agrocybe chaxingu]|uniref:Uncharacterized protein n=1 Tax=Agrocybe chaxingu TaxID=84603 RepID=A0A9W8JNX1_9AGAR|nr:hypothetical protein NLJ89_g11342 [Agrocybe chaxingu]